MQGHLPPHPLGHPTASAVGAAAGLTAETGSEWAGKVLRHFPVFTSHIRTLGQTEGKERGDSGSAGGAERAVAWPRALSEQLGAPPPRPGQLHTPTESCRR